MISFANYFLSFKNWSIIDKLKNFVNYVKGSPDFSSGHERLYVFRKYLMKSKNFKF